MGGQKVVSLIQKEKYRRTFLLWQNTTTSRKIIFF